MNIEEKNKYELTLSKIFYTLIFNDILWKCLLTIMNYIFLKQKHVEYKKYIDLNCFVIKTEWKYWYLKHYYCLKVILN